MPAGKKGRDEGYGKGHGSCVQVGMGWESVAGYVEGKAERPVLAWEIGVCWTKVAIGPYLCLLGFGSKITINKNNTRRYLNHENIIK